MGDNEAGKLYICATPIGNLEDITLRVLRILQEVDLIAAEDTRNSAVLLKHYDITTPMTSYHEHNEATKAPVLLDKLKNGASIALISDGGMPCLSDPGYVLVRACYDAGIEATVLPGASAGLAALVLSGISARRYVFEGFVPQKASKRDELLAKLAHDGRAIVIYEAPHRILDTLIDLHKAFGDRQAAAVREITKKFEQVNRGKLSELAEHFTHNLPRGEFVLVIEGCIDTPLDFDMSISEHVDGYIGGGMAEKEAIKKVAKERGLPKRDVYQEYKIQ